MSVGGKSFTEAFRSGDPTVLGQEAINKQVAKDSWWPSLTFKQRIIGFIIWMILGVIFSLLSFGVLLNLAKGKPARFAVPYTLGVLCSLAGSMFLMGPWKQVKRMFAKTRIIVTLIVILSIIMTLVSAFVFKNAWLVLLFVIIQYLAFTWYSLSYIPYARTLVIKFFTSWCKR